MTGRGAIPALAFSCVTGVLVLYLMEFGVRSLRADPGIEAVERAEAEGRPFDPRSRMDVVRDLRAAGVAAVPRLIPAALRRETRPGEFHSRIELDGREVFPLAGISRRTTVLCNESGEYAVFESDEHGFRNPRGIWDSAPVDLLLIGDSFTIGECVGPGESIGDRLRLRFPAAINLGYGGNSPLLELATLVEYGARLRPRTTLWFYFENDLAWFDIGKDRRTPVLMRYLTPGFSQGLVARQPDIDASLDSLLEAADADADEASPIERLRRVHGTPGDRWPSWLRLKSLRTAIGRQRHRLFRASREPPDFELFRATLARARETVAQWNGELVFVYLPGVWTFGDASEVPSWRSPEAPRRVRELVASLGLPLIDIETAMRTHPDPPSLYAFRGLSALGSPHLGRDGYAYTAEVVADRLER